MCGFVLLSVLFSISLLLLSLSLSHFLPLFLDCTTIWQCFSSFFFFFHSPTSFFYSSIIFWFISIFFSFFCFVWIGILDICSTIERRKNLGYSKLVLVIGIYHRFIREKSPFQSEFGIRIKIHHPLEILPRVLPPKRSNPSVWSQYRSNSKYGSYSVVIYERMWVPRMRLNFIWGGGGEDDNGNQALPNQNFRGFFCLLEGVFFVATKDFFGRWEWWERVRLVRGGGAIL